MTRPRRLPTGIDMRVSIEGRPVVLPAADAKDTDLSPQIMLFSSGDLNLFELTLQRTATGEGVRLAPAENTERIDVTPLKAAAA
jgi:hypothetical protein